MYNTGNPVPSAALEDMADNAQTFDALVTKTEGTTTDRKGVNRRVFQQILMDMGFQPLSGSFQTGATITARNQTLYDEVSHVFYAWGGALPKVVAAGSTPATAGGIGVGVWVDKTDLMLRGELGDDDSSVLIAGEIASNIALRSAGDDYTLIQPSAKFIEATIGSSTQFLECVITGDSLSFNAFGYPVGWSTNGGGYATDNPFGLSSWSHIIRDLWVSSSNAFTPIDKVLVSTDTTQSYLSSTSIQHVGMNGKAVAFTFSTTSKKLAITAPGDGTNISLIISYAPSADAVNFTVNGTSYSNETPNGHYLGYGYMIIPVSGTSATITGVSKVVGGGAGSLIVYGAGGAASGINVPKLTGKGAWTSGQILSEFDTLIAPYTPDIIFYIIGANDINQSIPISTFKSNIESFIDQARAVKNPCEIVLISAPPSTSYTRVAAKSYIKVMRDVAISKSCSLIDLYSKLEKTDPSYYRYDNIHFTAEGNNLVYSIIKELIFQGVPNVPSIFRQSAQCFAGVGGGFYKNRVGRLETISYVLNCTATNPTVTINRPLWVSANTASAAYSGTGTSSKVVFTPPAGYYVSSIIPLAIDTSSTRKSIELGATVLGSDSVDLVLMSSTGRIDIINSGQYSLINVSRL